MKKILITALMVLCLGMAANTASANSFDDVLIEYSKLVDRYEQIAESGKWDAEAVHMVNQQMLNMNQSLQAAQASGEQMSIEQYQKFNDIMLRMNNVLSSMDKNK